MKKVGFCLVVFVAIVLCSGFSFFSKPENLGRVMVLSVSSDGDYAISSNSNKGVILWDIKNETYKVVSKNGNIYSAYFIKNSPYFIWQDLNNYVHVDNVSGEEILRFLNFPVYGQVMGSNLKTYFASDINWALFSAYKTKQKKINPGYLSFLGTGKLLNLTLSNDDEHLLTSGFSGDAYGPAPLDSKKGKYNLDGVVLWDTETGRPIRKFTGNATHVFATFSPDGKYIVAGDMDSLAFVWRLHGDERMALYDLLYGQLISLPGGKVKWNRKGLIPAPKNTKASPAGSVDRIVALKFIDNNHYLRFASEEPFVALYNVSDPKPLKYFSLGVVPRPSVYNFTRDESIDTAPKAHILVTGQLKGNGIIVYKYNSKNQTLKKIWVGTL